MSSPVIDLPRSSMSMTNIHPMQTRSKYDILKPEHILSLATGFSESEPSSFKEAMHHPRWKAAMSDEFDALVSNNT